MKKVALTILTFYQWILSPILKQIIGPGGVCRYSPSCSEYARIAIVRYGVWQGSYKAFRRLLTCHPWYTPKSTTSKL